MGLETVAKKIPKTNRIVRFKLLNQIPKSFVFSDTLIVGSFFILEKLTKFLSIKGLPDFCKWMVIKLKN